MPVERQRRLDGVPEDQHQRMGHRARRAQPGEPCTGRRRRTDAATHDRRVVEHVRDIRVDVPRPEADHRLGPRGLDAFARRRGPARRLRQHPQEGCLVQPELAVAGADAEDDLLRADLVAVVERFEARLTGIGVRQDVPEQVLRLVDPAQHGVLPCEDLHGHERIATFRCEDPFGSREVHVGGVARQDLDGRSGALHAHQAGTVARLPASSTIPPRIGQTGHVRPAEEGRVYRTLRATGPWRWAV